MLVMLTLRHTAMIIFFTAGKEFEFVGHNGHTMLISKALYVLTKSGARWCESFS